MESPTPPFTLNSLLFIGGGGGGGGCPVSLDFSFDRIDLLSFVVWAESLMFMTHDFIE